MKIDWKDVSYLLNETGSREKDLIILNVLEVIETYTNPSHQGLEESLLTTLLHHKLVKKEEENV